MAIFAIIAQPSTNAASLADAVQTHFGDSNYKVAGGHWLVATNRTAKEVSDALGVSDGAVGAGIVVEVASYFGRANPDIWTWIKAHWEAGEAR